MRILCRHRGRTDGGCRRPILLRIHRRQSTELEPGLLGLHAEALDLAEMVEEQAPQRHGNDHGDDRQPGRRPAAVLDDHHGLGWAGFVEDFLEMVDFQQVLVFLAHPSHPVLSSSSSLAGLRPIARRR